MLDPDGVRHPLVKFAHVINVYLNSAFAVTSQAAEEMAKNEPLASNQRGVIINTASIAGFEGQPGQAAYSAAKGSIIGTTLTIARDLAERPAELRDLNGKVVETAVLEPLPTMVLDEAIRSGVNHPSDTFGPVLISAHIHAHNTSVGSLVSMEGNRIDPKVLRGAINRLKWRQEVVAGYCRQLIDVIEALSIPESVLRNSKKSKTGGSPAPNITSGASATSASSTSTG
jgi:short-subunit dehydrogenase